MKRTSRASFPFKRSLLCVAVLSASAAFAAQDDSKTSEFDMLVVEGQATAGLDAVVTEEQLQDIQAND